MRMKEYFDDEQSESHLLKAKRDTELTLGVGSVFVLFIGLVLLCGLCFGLGYEVGRGNKPTSVAYTPAPSPTPEEQAAAAKPSAAPVSDSVPSGSAPLDVDEDSSARQPGQSTESVTIREPDAPAVAAQRRPGAVRPAALPPAHAAASSERFQQPERGTIAERSTGAAQQAANPYLNSSAPQHVFHSEAPPATSAAHVQAALPQRTQAASAYGSVPATSSGSFVVQIAAVGNPADGDLLIAELRKHGYSVSARHEADSLIHIRIGPYSNRDEANRWRQKLLNDGYNAMVQP